MALKSTTIVLTTKRLTECGGIFDLANDNQSWFELPLRHNYPTKTLIKIDLKDWLILDKQIVADACNTHSMKYRYVVTRNPDVIRKHFSGQIY